MKGLLLAGALLGASLGVFAPTASMAQVEIDMGRVTCGEYLVMPEAQSVMFASWMSGWIHQKVNRTEIDLVLMKKNISSVRGWCGSHKDESVMRGLYDALGIKQ